jgi:hypothetical protein
VRDESPSGGGVLMRRRLWLLSLTSITLIAAIVAVVAAPARHHKHTLVLGEKVVGGGSSNPSNPLFASAALSTPTAFTITSADPGQLLPAVTRTLTLTVHNPFSVPITVTTLTVKLGTPIPSGCGGSSLTLNGTSLAGTVTLPESMNVAAGGTAPATASLLLTGSQAACENATFTFTYGGTAQYTDSTGLTLASSPNPANAGAAVTFTATLSPTYTESSTPTGTVTFYLCTNSTCTTTTTLGTEPVNATTGVATMTKSTLPPGADSVFASYGGSGTDFGSSTSPTIVETINGGGCSSIPTTGAGTVTTGTVNANVTVASGQSYWLNGGTINGNVTVASGGKFAATGGKIAGNLSSAGAVTLNGTKLSGNYAVTGGGPACGGGSVTLAGNVSMTGLTGSGTATLCGLTIQGNVQVTNNAEPVQIGGAGCGGNTIQGNLSVTGNSGLLTIGGTSAGNTVAGNIQVSGNTGGGTLTANSAKGNCSLSGDSPKIVGSANTATGSNSCNGTA